MDFIGEYFGLNADEEDFALLWTDTRTGVQELFSDVVHTKKVSCPRIPELVGTILAGIVEDGGGLIIVGGKVVRVPPRSPVLPQLEELAQTAAVRWTAGLASGHRYRPCGGRRRRYCDTASAQGDGLG